MKKFIILFWSIIFFSKISTGQNCHIEKTDASGYNTVPFQAILETASCNLRNSLPADLASQFKVIEYGFYLMSPSTIEGIPPVFEIAKADAILESPYYLLIAKQTDQTAVYSKFWIDIKLPNTGQFACITESVQATIKEMVALKIEETYSKLGRDIFQYAEAEVAGINYLTSILTSIATGNCCPISLTEIENILLSRGYDYIPAKIKERTISAKPPSNAQKINNSIENYADLLSEFEGEVGFEDLIHPLSEEIDRASEAGIMAKGYLTKNKNLCEPIGKQILEGFANDYFMHIHYSENPDTLKPGKIFFKTKKGPKIVAVNLPEIEIVATGNCNAPHPLPPPYVYVPNQWSPPLNYAITKHQDKYYGFHTVGGSWQPSDSVEYYRRKPFEPTENDHTWGDGGATRTVLGDEVIKYEPSFEAWRLQHSTATQKLEDEFYKFLCGIGDDFKEERFKIFKQLKYANFNPPSSNTTGSSLNWDCTSRVSTNLHDFPQVKAGIDEVHTVIKNWLKTHNDLDGLFLDDANFDGFTNYVNLSDITHLWTYQAFGWTQGIRVQVKSFKRSYSTPCLQSKAYEVEMLYTLYDVFGNGVSDAKKTWFPGLVELWVLQHYRNYNCPGFAGPAYIPITNHTVEIIDKSIICVPN